jgi:hypothetical protein
VPLAVIINLRQILWRALAHQGEDAAPRQVCELVVLVCNLLELFDGLGSRNSICPPESSASTC